MEDLSFGLNALLSRSPILSDYPSSESTSDPLQALRDKETGQQTRWRLTLDHLLSSDRNFMPIEDNKSALYYAEMTSPAVAVHRNPIGQKTIQDINTDTIRQPPYTENQGFFLVTYADYYDNFDGPNFMKKLNIITNQLYKKGYISEDVQRLLFMSFMGDSAITSESKFSQNVFPRPNNNNIFSFTGVIGHVGAHRIKIIVIIPKGNIPPTFVPNTFYSLDRIDLNSLTSLGSTLKQIKQTETTHAPYIPPPQTPIPEPNLTHVNARERLGLRDTHANVKSTFASLVETPDGGRKKTKIRKTNRKKHANKLKKITKTRRRQT